MLTRRHLSGPASSAGDSLPLFRDSVASTSCPSLDLLVQRALLHVQTRRDVLLKIVPLVALVLIVLVVSFTRVPPFLNPGPRVPVRHWVSYEYENPPDSFRSPERRVPAATVAAPVVTVISTVFNTPPALIRETAASLQHQTLASFEWVIVDDGSSDADTLAGLEVLCAADPRIRCLRSPTNVGLPGARNLGLDVMRGRYVYYLDADDLIEPTTLEQLAWFLETHPGVCVANGWTAGFGAFFYSWMHGFEDGNTILTSNVLTVSVMHRRAVALSPVGRWDASLRHGMEDWDLILRLASNKCWGYTLPDFLMWYRRRTNRDNWKTLGDQEAERLLREELQRRYAALYHNGMPPIHLDHSASDDSVLPLQPAFENPVTTLRVHEPTRAMSAAANRTLSPSAAAWAATAFAPIQVSSFVAPPPTARRMLMIIPWMVLGGADAINLDVLAETVARRNWTVTIVATRQTDHTWLSRFAAFTDDILITPNFLRGLDLPRFLEYVVRSRRIDVVFLSNSQLGYALLPFLRRTFPALPIVDYVHMEEGEGGYPRDSGRLSIWLDSTMYTSQHLVEWCAAREDTSPKRNVVVRAGVPDTILTMTLEERNAARRELEVQDSSIVILYSCRLVDQKRPWVVVDSIGRLVRALSDESPTKPSFVVHVVGDGPLRASMEEQVARERLEPWFRFFGEKRRDELVPFFRSADIFYLPSSMEGVSVAVIEAMAYGLTVVASRVGGQVEIIDTNLPLPRITAFLVPLGARDAEDAESFARVLLRLVSDPPSIRVIGQRAKDSVIAQGLTRSTFGDRLVAEMEHVIQHPEARRPLPPQAPSMQETLDRFVHELRDRNVLAWSEPQPHDVYA